ncbi:MAG: hypothetical protein KGJ13_11500, partial [Patescibacteria group bacterium]|nr:hypothetical protein [Patescibacteria group bacterium]
ESQSLHAEICRRVGALRDSIKANVEGLRDALNESRAVGQLILKEEEKLPGKQITFDFFKQQEKTWVDPQGRPITFENIKHFKRIAGVETGPVDDVVRALSWRNELLEFIGINAGGEAPGRNPVEKGNQFILLARDIPKLAHVIEMRIKAVENDPHYGSLDALDSDETAILRAKIDVARRILDALDKRLPKG